ncbi:hypothetical protein [Kocuria rosea]|uniref:hypothetical protein n=1 Tax=Kocuria rosea TaxID=1275 RepID=UPI00253F9411|nr:hypothetical protein [Kocuria rosea]WIG19228.1 hypothetical protein QOY29_17255 [Kocuria rosea]
MVAISGRADRGLRRVLGSFVLILGGVAVAFTWPAFSVLAPGDQTWGWMFLALGAVTMLMGVWLVVGRWRGKPLVLSKHPWRLGFFAVVAAVYFTAFVVFARPVPGEGEDVGPLILPGCAAWLVGFAVCALFVPAESEAPRRKGPLRYTPAGRKTAHRLLLLMGGASVALVLLGLLLGHWVHPWFAETFAGSGLFGLAVTAVMTVRVSRAVPVEEGGSNTASSDAANGRKG